MMTKRNKRITAILFIIVCVGQFVFDPLWIHHRLKQQQQQEQQEQTISNLLKTEKGRRKLADELGKGVKKNGFHHSNPIGIPPIGIP